MGLPGSSAVARPVDIAASRSIDEPMEVLCQRLQASDRAAFESVFRLLREDLLRYVRSILNDDVTAHDLVQDVFVALWGLRVSLDPTQSLKAYLYRMARNRAYRHLRDERTHARKESMLKEEAAATPPRSATPDDTVTAGDLQRRLRAWIDDLPARQREALVLSRFHGLSHREIADVMDVSPRTVNNHIVRALDHLHDRILAFEPALLES